MQLKKSLITIMTLVMLFSTSNSIYAINDEESNEVETTQEEIQENEGLVIDEQETNESEMTEEKNDESLENQTQVDEVIDKVPFYNEDGELYYEEVTDGTVDDPINPRLRSAFSDSSILVNFNQGGGTTNYIDAVSGRTGYVYGAYGADAAYLGMSGNKVKFMMGGVIGYVSSGSVQLASAKKYYESYYIVESGKLNHYICTNINNKPSSKNYIGPGPSYLSSGVKYYSYDGHYFYSNYDVMTEDYNAGHRIRSVNPGSPFYSYFQFLPLRSTTTYSGSQLDSYIISVRGANTNSKMKNLGSSFISYQNTYGINGLLAFGVACNESAYGTSSIAQSKNNLFGLDAIDSNPSGNASIFESPEASIRDFMANWMSTGYLDATDSRYRGGHYGDKGSGANVSYASDPYWGEKASGIALRADEYLGGKDYNRYTVAVSDTLPNGASNVSVTTSPGGGSTLYRQGLTPNYPVIVLGTSGNYYRIQSDSVLNAAGTAINKTGTTYNFTKDRGYVNKSTFTTISNGTGSNPTPTPTNPSIVYNAHVSDLGWLGAVSDGAIGGTTGQNRKMEGIQLALNGGSYSGGIQYRTHVQNLGWQGFISGGTSGSTGRGLQLEAIEIKLTGSIASSFDIYYSLHVQDLGWIGWAKNGESAGTQGFGKAIEAIKVVLVAKNGSAPGSTTNHFYTNNVVYRAHVQDIGWQGTVTSGNTAGTQNQSRRIEALQVSLDRNMYSGSIQYRSHVQDIGWQGWVSDGNTSGTTGIGKSVEAIQMRLTGALAEKYDVYYRVHTQHFGWLDWAKNGESAGTASYGYRVEAIQIQLFAKGDSSAPTNRAYHYYTRNLYYSTHVEDIGWQENVWNGALGGTTGQAKRVEAIRVNLFDLGNLTGGIQYRAHVQDIGWQGWVSNGALCGTQNQSRRLEALQIRLTGNVANTYDVYYRVHVQDFGWLGWAKNGASSGTEGLSKRIEGVEIQLVAKGGQAPGTTNTPFRK